MRFSLYHSVTPQIATTREALTSVFQLRHLVYCEELAWEPNNQAQQESDNYDTYSTHCLLLEKDEHKPVGTVRVVLPEHPAQSLPLEKYFTIPQQREAHKISEISRLVLHPHFRGRQTNSDSPLLHQASAVVMLYQCCAAILQNSDREWLYTMMEPKLSRHLKAIGLPLLLCEDKLINGVQRGLYFAHIPTLVSQFKPDFSRAVSFIAEQLGFNSDTQQRA